LKKHSTMWCLWKIYLRFKTIHSLKIKGCKRHSIKWQPKKAGAVVLLPDKKDFKSKYNVDSELNNILFYSKTSKLDDNARC
jgi:hypothetical protein